MKIMAKEFLNKVEEEEKSSKEVIDNAKHRAEKMVKDTQRDAVDYINSVTDKAQKFAAAKIMQAEKKAQEILDDTKATSKSTARSLNNLVDKKSSEIKNTLDSILFE